MESGPWGWDLSLEGGKKKEEEEEEKEKIPHMCESIDSKIWALRAGFGPQD